MYHKGAEIISSVSHAKLRCVFFFFCVCSYAARPHVTSCFRGNKAEVIQGQPACCHVTGLTKFHSCFIW